MDYLTGRRELMPKGGPPLSGDRIALIRRWIAEGARPQIGGPIAFSPGAGSSGVSSRPGGLPNRVRPGIGAGRAASVTGPQLLEGYSGHLMTNDLSFSLRLHLDKTATAVWSLTPGREIRYTGSFVGEDSNYVVTLAQSNSPPAEQGKTLTLQMVSHGSQETGAFGLDGARPRRVIAALELRNRAPSTSDPAPLPAQARPAAEATAHGDVSG